MEGEEGSKTESPKHGRRSTTIRDEQNFNGKYERREKGEKKKKRC